MVFPELSRLGPNRVVPFPMKLVWVQADRGQFRVADLAPLFVCAVVQFAAHRQAFGRRGRCDEADDGLVVDQGLAAPVHGDEREHPMLDLVPLARAWWEVANRDREAQIVGELLEFQLPQANAVAVAAAAVGGDQEFARLQITLRSHGVPPPADRFDGELGRVRADADAHPARVFADVVHAVWARPPEFSHEIMNVDLGRLALGTQLASAVLVVADQLLLLGIH